MLLSTKSTSFSYYIYYFFIIDKTSSRTGWSGFPGRIWPSGRSLDNPALDGWQTAWRQVLHSKVLSLHPQLTIWS